MTWMTAADERPHAPGGDPWWGESWDLAFATPDATVGGFVRLGLLPNQRTCWYWACVLGAGRDLVLVVDHDVRPPRPGDLELRSEGLWADHIVEEPLEHVSVGCEAFALRLDDPLDAVAGPVPVGERTPFGLDLGWETDPGGSPVDLAVGAGYALPCRVVGGILVGDERIELDGVGWRRHAWGVEDWWSRPWRTTHGWRADGTWSFDHDDATSVTCDDVAVAAIRVPSDDGRVAHHTRTLGRSSTPAVPTAVTWVEHTVPGPRPSG